MRQPKGSSNGIIFGQGRAGSDYWSLLVMTENSVVATLFIPGGITGFSKDFLLKLTKENLLFLRKAIDNAIDYFEAKEKQ